MNNPIKNTIVRHRRVVNGVYSNLKEENRTITPIIRVSTNLLAAPPVIVSAVLPTSVLEKATVHLENFNNKHR